VPVQDEKLFETKKRIKPNKSFSSTNCESIYRRVYRLAQDSQKIHEDIQQLHTRVVQMEQQLATLKADQLKLTIKDFTSLDFPKPGI
jgi:cell division protein FtsB